MDRLGLARRGDRIFLAPPEGVHVGESDESLAVDEGEFASAGDGDSLGCQIRGSPTIAGLGEQQCADGPALDLPLSVGRDRPSVYLIGQCPGVVMASLVVDGTRQVDRDSREEPLVPDLDEGLFGFQQMPLSAAGIAAEGLHVGAEQAVNSGLPIEAEIMGVAKAVGDARSCLLDLPSKRLLESQEAVDVGSHDLVAAGIFEDGGQARDRILHPCRAFEKAEAVLAHGPRLFPLTAGNAGVLRRPEAPPPRP